MLCALAAVAALVAPQPPPVQFVAAAAASAATSTVSATHLSVPNRRPDTVLGIQHAAPLAVSDAAQLQAILDHQRTKRHIPGVAAAVIFPDGSTWQAGSGYAQLNPDELATPSTPFVVASITKTFVTATIMQLADEGALSIDDPLSNWLPDYPRANRITLRQLLRHTSGVYNYLEYPSFSRRVFKTDRGHYWTPQEILDTFVGPPDFAPGKGFHYSNTGFILLGLVIEKATGQNIGDVFAQRFFSPLGLKDTYFQGSGPPPSTSAQGYAYLSGVWNEWSDGTNYRPGISGATVSWSAGAIAASAHDIATWCAALYGGHVVSANALAQMENFSYPYSKGWYGMGTWTRVHKGVRMVGHIGSFHGFDAAMWYYPDTGMTVVVLTNLAKISANPIADALADAARAASSSLFAK